MPGVDPFNLIKLSDDDLKRDPQALADELVARSLLGGDRLVRRGRHDRPHDRRFTRLARAYGGGGGAFRRC